MKKPIIICLALLFSVTSANANSVCLLLKDKNYNGKAFSMKYDGKYFLENSAIAELFSPEKLDGLSKNPRYKNDAQLGDGDEYFFNAVFGPDKLTNYGKYARNQKVHPGFQNSSNNSQTAPVPEPATMLLLGAGLAGLAFGTRKKKMKTDS